MSDVLKNEISVSFEGAEYLFKIPTIHDDIAVGARARDVRRRIIGADGDISEEGLDFFTTYLCRACATFETILLKGPNWVFNTTVPTAPGPKCDTSKFNSEQSETVVAVYAQYQDQLNSFRQERNKLKSNAIPKAMAG